MNDGPAFRSLGRPADRERRPHHHRQQPAPPRTPPASAAAATAARPRPATAACGGRGSRRRSRDRSRGWSWGRRWGCPRPERPRRRSWGRPLRGRPSVPGSRRASDQGEERVLQAAVRADPFHRHLQHAAVRRAGRGTRQAVEAHQQAVVGRLGGRRRPARRTGGRPRCAARRRTAQATPTNSVSPCPTISPTGPGREQPALVHDDEVGAGLLDLGQQVAGDDAPCGRSPRSGCSTSRISRICGGSRPLVGSSRISRSGRPSMACAMASRCRMPCE